MEKEYFTESLLMKFINLNKIRFAAVLFGACLSKCLQSNNDEMNIYEPRHEKMCLMSYANNKGTDQPAHLCSLISAFVVRCLDSIMSLDSIAEISRL